MTRYVHYYAPQVVNCSTYFVQYTVPEDRVWGVAYRIEASKVDEVKSYLDIREINGYSIQHADFHPAADAASSVKQQPRPFKCLVYIGMPNNPQFVGVQEPEGLAQHIFRSRGPSGENQEYLFMLDTALQALSPSSGDAHIRDLAQRVRRIASPQSQPARDAAQDAKDRETSRIIDDKRPKDDQGEET